MAFRVKRPDTAFSLEPSRQRKRPRVQDDQHLKWIRTLPCCLTGKRKDVEAAHVRYGDPAYGKRPTGMQEKPSDRWTVPLCAEKHRLTDDAQHNGSEREFWKREGVDPLDLAARLYAVSGDDEAAALILGRGGGGRTK